MKKWTLFFENRLFNYDEHMLTAIKGADEFYKYTAAQLPQEAESEVLDLGCGTGLELEEYFLLNPKVHITGIDLSKVMLKTLAAKFPDRNLTLICNSYFDVELGFEKYDAAVSVESLHHFTSQRKMSFYQKLLLSLKSNGFFVLTDYFAESEEVEKKYFKAFEKLKQEQNISDDVFYHYDTPLTVEHEIAILRKAGFSYVRVLKNWEATYTLLAGR